jgi:hypothetical protein
LGEIASKVEQDIETRKLIAEPVIVSFVVFYHIVYRIHQYSQTNATHRWQQTIQWNRDWQSYKLIG